MNVAHLHIAINHFPIIGLAFSLGILVVAAARKSPQLARVGLASIVAVAVISIAVYLTGEPAEKLVEHLSGISREQIEAHEETALMAFIGIEVLGLLAMLGLVVYRVPGSLPRWYLPVLILLGLVTAGWVGYTSNLGGQISHPEARPDFRTGTGEAEEDEISLVF